MSEQVKWIMHERNVAVSQTTPYNTQCNRLTERYNSIFHKAIQLLQPANDLSPFVYKTLDTI